MEKIRTVSWSGKAALGDLTVKWRWAAVWCALVSMACLAFWNAGGEVSPAAKAATLAASAAKASISGASEASKLAGMMTEAALQKAMADRAASGLDAALSSSSAKVEAAAWTVKSIKAGDSWIEWGFATAKISGQAGAAGSWTGAWRARVARGADGFKVEALSMATLPEGAKMDASSLVDEEREPVQATQAHEWPGLKLDAKLDAHAKKN